MKIAFEVAAAGADELGECPIWDERSASLWWVDSRAPALKRLDPGSGAVTVLPVAETIGSIAFRERGGLLAATRSGYVTSARQRMSAEELAGQPLAGSVLALRAGVQGLPESRFAG